MALTEYSPADFLNSLGSKTNEVKEYSPTDFLSSLTANVEPAVKTQAQTPNALKGAEFFARNPLAPNLIPESFKEPLIGAGEAATSMLTGAVATPIGAITGILTNIFRDKYGTQEGIQLAEKTAGDIIKTLTYEPKSEKGKEYTQILSQLPAKITGSTMGAPVPEVWNAAPLVKPAISQLTSEVKALAGGVTIPEPVRNTYNKYMGDLGQPTLQEQFANKQAGNVAMPPKAVEVFDPATGQPVVTGQQAPTINPALAQKVTQIEQAGGTVNPEAIDRQNKALSVDPRLQLTEGQALQDANLISTERNDRGIKEQLVGKFNEQNQIFKERAEIYKNEFTPDVKGLSYVENSAQTMNAVDNIVNSNETLSKNAYKDLKKLEAGKLSIDGKTIGQKAKEALALEDVEDYVPSQILNRINAYADGSKQMNFNLYKGLGSKIAAESRKADRAGDGNTVFALSLVRNELEQLPLVGETAQAKIVADKARNIYKANRDLEANNDFYGDAVKGKFDTKTFVPKVAFGPKNEYFGQAMDILDKDPIAKQHFAQGTMDYMIRESTDGSGNLNVMKMANFVDDLQLNGRLVPLFGEVNANKLLQYAEVARFTKSTPEGSFVNFSNTTPSAANMVQRYGPAAAEIVGANMGIPFVGTVAKKSSEFMEKRKNRKQAEKSTEFGAGVEKSSKGTKISDILKE